MTKEDKILELLYEIRREIYLQPVKDILTFDEFCEYAGVSRSFAYKLTSQRKIPFSKPTGKLIYIERKDADAWMRSNKIEIQ